MIDLNKHKLKLDYPCSWKYKVVILELTNLNHILKEVFKEREYKSSKSNVSKKGKFQSFNIELIVHSDDDRKEIHKLLSENKNIKMVL